MATATATATIIPINQQKNTRCLCRRFCCCYSLAYICDVVDGYDERSHINVLKIKLISMWIERFQIENVAKSSVISFLLWIHANTQNTLILTRIHISITSSQKKNFYLWIASRIFCQRKCVIVYIWFLWFVRIFFSRR